MGDWHEELHALEAALLTGAVRKDSSALEALLAEDFLEFGSSGRTFSRAEIIAELRDEVPAKLTLREFRVERLSDAVALVTYRSIRSEFGGAAREALRSSVWVRRDGRWQMRFHQGTRVAGPRTGSPVQS